EIGGWVTPSASFHFNRDCPNGLGVARGRGETNGSLFYGYGRAGAMFSTIRTARPRTSGENLFVVLLVSGPPSCLM
ncbi:hypothetical protein, partial [Stenotrophomonas maltophilia]|uniref:hypothetical protein n=1 Tax=Stenotrophomonas maltophilia TaxID=40324 RepID=UPI0019535DB4